MKVNRWNLTRQGIVVVTASLFCSPALLDYKPREDKWHQLRITGSLPALAALTAVHLLVDPPYPSLEGMWCLMSFLLQNHYRIPPCVQKAMKCPRAPLTLCPGGCVLSPGRTQAASLGSDPRLLWWTIYHLGWSIHHLRVGNPSYLGVSNPSPCVGISP